MLKTVVYDFKILWWIESSKEQHLFEIESFCNIINAFTVSFDQFNASLLNKSIHFFQKTKNKKTFLLTPNFWTVVYVTNAFYFI